MLGGNLGSLLYGDVSVMFRFSSISNGFVSSKIYDKRDGFDIVIFPFLDGNGPCRTSYGVYISQIIRFVRVRNHVTDVNVQQPNFSSRAIGIINFKRLFFF